MTVVVRKIRNIAAWERFLERGSDVDNLPYPMLHEFTPDIENQIVGKTLSVYCVDHIEKSIDIAAALTMASGGKFQRCLVATASVDELKKNNIQLNQSAGETAIEEIDDLHRDLIIQNQKQFISVAKIFAASEYKIFSSQEIKAAIVRLFVESKYDFVSIAKKSGKLSDNIFSSAKNLIGDGLFSIVSSIGGAPASGLGSSPQG